MNFNNSNFNTSNFNRSRNTFSVMKFLIIFLIVIIFIGYISFATKAKTAGKNVYTITVHNFQTDDSYLSYSIISQDANKIVFFDMLGMKKTIVSPGISVTQY